MPDIAAAINATIEAIATPYQTQTRALGPSKLATYLACPMAFKLVYEDGRRFANGAEAVLGTAIHAVISHGHEWQWGPDNRKDAADMLAGIWEAVDPEQVIRRDDPAVELAFRSARDKWLPWYLHWAQGQTTIVHEERWETEYEGVELTGTIDRIYSSPDGIVLSDVKSGKRAPGDEQLTTHLQLSIYDWVFCDLCGAQPHALEIVHLRGMQTYRTRRTPEYLQQVMDMTVVPAARMIEHCRATGVWPCNPGTLYGCHYCECRPACPVGLGGNDDGC